MGSGIPPSQSGSTPPSKGGKSGPTSKSDQEQKAFRLKEQEKKKQQLEAADQEGQQVKQQMGQKVEQSSVQATEKTAGLQATQVKQVAQIIQRNVESMRIGEVDGKTLASATLKGPDLPEAFAGSHLNLSYTENGLDISFTNMTPEQALRASQMVEQNKDQLQEMVMNLQAKNIAIHEMTIGEHVVSLTTPVEPVRSPFEPPSTEAQTQQDRQQQQQDEGTTDPDR